ncbi:hypothetical protein WMY93_012490 [Mugilogobius chulae]|uniref:Interferon-induced GTP-binding protein Mx n=1 Tax=Mugilogobius chulae TaxID=88201 RepID=A0AAW0P969_9GOBI
MELSPIDKVRSCIDIVDLLHSLGRQDLALPAIAVIGDQSSGKSSVLEALSGVALPRAKGENYTLHLKMNKTKGSRWYAILKYRPVRYSNTYEEIRIDHLKDMAEKINKGKSYYGLLQPQIFLEIYSPHVPDLTLIALPSIPSVANERPQTIEKIKQYIKKIITNPECIILVVVPCNVNIASTEALKMAKEVDPGRARTLGLLTKPDLVDQVKEKDIVDIVQNKVIKLKKGFMMVRCYDQTNNVSMDSTEKEQNFFKDHALFKPLYDGGFATFPKLAERLNKELAQQMEKCLPQLKEYVKNELLQASALLRKLGNTPPSDEADKRTFLTDKLTTFTQDIMRLTTGELLDITDQTVFSVWRQTVTESDELCQCKLELENTLDEQCGFSNSETLDHVIKNQIKLLEEPAVFSLNKFTGFVKAELLKLTNKHFFGFSELRSKAEV